MQGKINLLPREPQKTKEAESLIKLIKRATYITAILFILIGPIGGFSIYKFTKDHNKLKAENEILRESITNLESTEQGLVLLKDRVGKIQNILSSSTYTGIHAKQTEIINSLPDGLSFEESELGGDVSRLTILAKSSKALENLFNQISANDHFTTLLISDLNFNPYLGYTFDIQVF